MISYKGGGQLNNTGLVPTEGKQQDTTKQVVHVDKSASDGSKTTYAPDPLTRARKSRMAGVVCSGISVCG